MNKEIGLGLGLGLVGTLLILVNIHGCGQQQGGGGGGVTTNYTIAGKYTGVTVAGVKGAAALAVTDIVAIGADGERYKATLSADGAFSVGVVKGWPYVLGFYNKSGGTITLLGYLKQKDVGWDSLPLIAPSGDTTDLGTVEVDQTSAEATPSIALNSLIGQMDMDLSIAQYYGQMDDPLTVLTNLDVDGNGEFDFNENIGYTLVAKIGMMPGFNSGAGEIGQMLNGHYNESYRPSPNGYVILFGAGNGAAAPPAGTTATLKFPVQVSNGTSSFTSAVASVEGITSGGWTAAFDGDATPSVYITNPTVLPTGTYSVEVSGGWNAGRPFTFNNVQGTDLVKVGSTDKIIFPALNLVLDADSYITTVNYKWLIVESGAVRAATLAELRAVIADTESGKTALIDTSPSIGFFLKPLTYGGMKKIPLTGSSGSVDVSELRVKATTAVLEQIAVGYNLTSRVICDFRYAW
ncbi:MAG: hypothetical protein MUC35_07145 [Candidatus Margulisbacteria bacterium]|jgi:hypothetical protein|nr:hypothetical protein [Candidatus Margulisiibacteriota bacterium]